MAESWTNFGIGGGITNVTSDGNMIEFNNHVNITGKLNIGGTLSIGGDLNVSGNTTYSLKNGARHLFGMNTKGFNAVQQQKLTASDAASSDHFGYSVSVYEDYVLIGAQGDDDPVDQARLIFLKKMVLHGFNKLNLRQVMVLHLIGLVIQ